MEEDFISGEVIVGFTEGLSVSEKDKIVQDFGLSVKTKMRAANAYLVMVPAGTEEEWIKKFEQLPSVRFAQKNFTYKVC